MNRPWLIWTLFAACVIVALAAMGYVSVMVIEADRREAAAARRAAFEENIRLALWRMDSALSPLIARENSRPYEVYQGFYPVRGYTPQLTPLDYGQVLLASPLRDPGWGGGDDPTSPQYVKLHFQLDPAAGTWTSPYASEQVRDLEVLRQRVGGERLVLAAPPLEPPAPVAVIAAAPSESAATGAPAPAAASAPVDAVAQAEAALDQAAPQQAAPAPVQQRYSPVQQQALSQREYEQRARSQVLSNRLVKGSRADGIAEETTARDAPPFGAAAPVPPQVSEGPMATVWIEDELFLLRRVTVDGRELIQGVWLDWPAIERWLLAEVSDLLPDAKLERQEAGDRSQESGDRGQEATETRLLAAAPIRLLPGPIPGVDPALPGVPGIPGVPGGAPMRTSLWIAWACIGLAIVAVTVLLHGALALSERRGAFVSAVTHELRTPLTTFSLYTQMLAQGMVADSAKRQSYLDTLHRESQRLSHLVENVLAYARLERTRRNGEARQRIAIGGLISRMTERLAARADEAGMQLIVEVSPAAAEAIAETDVAAIERIVFNLVDNACKYARDAEDRRIELSAERQSGGVVIRVRDHGPGIAPDARRRLFRPFSKSAQAAAHSAPGVGLGLALTRRLARSLGGDLKLERTSDGTSFALTLRMA